MAITLSYPDGGALVTGGTGRVGEGAVRRLADAGVPVVFTYKSNHREAEALESELGEKGHSVVAQQMDTGDLDSIAAALDAVESKFGRVHSVVCGGGVPVSLDKLMDFRPDEVERFLMDDALGYYRVFNRAVAVMRRTGGGTINTCSTLALRRVFDYDGISPFSKGSVEALVRQVAAEEASVNIRCNAVSIGWVLRKSIDEFQGVVREETQEVMHEYAATMVKQLNTAIRLGRPATIYEIGDLFAFLASDQAAYITGQTIGFDGGGVL